MRCATTGWPASARASRWPQGALDLMRRIHADFEFKTASTEVDTPLIEVFEQRAGVCQDFAHLMIAALRMARPGGALRQRLPADACRRRGRRRCSAPTPRTPGCRCTARTRRGWPSGWLELDPTNDLVPDTSHVRLALGRDYGDVTPLRGVIRGGGRHTLEVRVNTRRVQDVAGPNVANLTLTEEPSACHPASMKCASAAARCASTTAPTNAG